MAVPSERFSTLMQSVVRGGLARNFTRFHCFCLQEIQDVLKRAEQALKERSAGSSTSEASSSAVSPAAVGSNALVADHPHGRAV